MNYFLISGIINVMDFEWIIILKFKRRDERDKIILWGKRNKENFFLNK